MMFQKAIFCLVLVVAGSTAEAGRQSRIKDKQRRNGLVSEEILKAERQLRNGSNGKGSVSKSAKSSKAKSAIDDETFCGIVTLAVSDIATTATRIQCDNLSPELLEHLCPSQDDLCASDFSILEFCPEDCTFQCENFLRGDSLTDACCQSRCCTGSDIGPDAICGVYEAATEETFTNCQDGLDREFCPCDAANTTAYCAAVAPACTAPCAQYAADCCFPSAT